MNERTKRPVTVWLTQVLLVLFGLIFLFIFVNGIIHSQKAFATPTSSLRFLAVALFLFSFIVIQITAFYGLVKREAYGRWLAVVSLVLIWAIILISQIRRPPGPLKYYEYNGSAEIVGAVIAQLLIHALFLFLILRL